MLGLVLSGCVITIGDSGASEVVVVPTEERSRVRSIANGNQETTEFIRTETVRNCSGGITSLNVTYSTAVGQAVEWRVGTTVGAGLEIGGNYLPGGVDLSVALSGELAPEISSGSGQEVAHNLSGSPNTIMEYDIKWTTTWQNATLDIETPTGAIETVAIRYISDINSSVETERQFDCNNSPVNPASPTLQPVGVQPTQVPVAVPTNVPTPSFIRLGREAILLQYNDVYRNQGWCALWSRLQQDGLIVGDCPPEPLNFDLRQDTGVIGVQIRIQSDITVNFPACIVYGTTGDYITYRGGRHYPVTQTDNRATDLELLRGSVFTLYFRCDSDRFE